MSMASSSTSSRNSLWPVRLSRRIVTLCWMSGWSNTYRRLSAAVVLADSGMARLPLSSVASSPLEVHHLVNPPLVAPAFKRRLEEGAHDVLGHLRARDALAHGDRIGVIVGAGQPGRGGIVADGAPHSRHLVRRHGLPVARAPP